MRDRNQHDVDNIVLMQCACRMVTDDQDDAEQLQQARTTLLRAGASRLGRRPWQQPGQPPPDTDLIRFAAWSARRPDTTDSMIIEAALRLLSAARAEVDQVEAGLLFAARSEGLTWPQIASALALASPQAAQQRFDRVLGRVGTDPTAE